MRPRLEQLEERCVPSDFGTYGFDVQRITIPPQFSDAYSQLLFVRVAEWLGSSPVGQWYSSVIGIPGGGYHWAPNRVFLVDMTPAQTGAWGLGGTTGREPFQIGNYLVAPLVFQPLVFASPGTDFPGSDGIGWELDSIERGWAYIDWNGDNGNYSHNLMPPGPQWGQFGQYANTFVNPPNYALADAVFVAEAFGGNSSLPPWWYFA